MELPFIGEVSLKVGIIVGTVLLAVFLHISMNAGTPAAAKLSDDAFDSLVDDGSGWAEDEGGEDKEAKAAAAKKATAAAAKAAVSGKQFTVPEKRAQMREEAVKAMEEAKKSIPKKVDEGPLKIGDRVIVKNGGGFDGRHGTVADLWNKESEEYPIDLDLIHPEMGGSVSLRAADVEKEPAIPDSLEEKRAALEKGVLGAEDAKNISFISTTMRTSVSQSANGEKDPKKLSNILWSAWIIKSKDKEDEGIYPSLKKYMTEQIVADGKVEELEKLGLNHEKIADAMTNPLGVGSWNVRVSGEFWLVGANPTGSLVVPVTNPRVVYAVVGLQMPLAVQVMRSAQCPRPPKVNLTLLPWFGRIVFDPVVSTTVPGRFEVSTPEQAAALVRAVHVAEVEGRVISRFAQLEVEKGSREGVPFKPFKIIVQVKQEAANDAELALIDNVHDFEAMELTPQEPNGHPHPMAAWNFIRKGNTEEENPDHEVLILSANGSQLETFKIKGLEPTAVEILKKMLAVSVKAGKRPAIIGIDEPKCCARLQFLLKDMKDIRVLGINVTRKMNPNPPPASG